MTGKTYLVTGTSKSRGLGLGLAKEILATIEDSTVVIAARNPSSFMQQVADKYPGRVILLTLSTTDEASVKAAVEELTPKLPNGLDYLLNNAGVAGGEGFPNPLEATKQHLLDTFETNVVGTFLVTQAFLPLLRKGSKKTIVNTSSALGSIQNVRDNYTGGGNYTVAADKALSYRQSKAALDMQGALLANVLKDEGFTILSLDPGWVATDFGQAESAGPGSEGPQASGPRQQDWDTETSCRKQLEVINGLKPEDSGLLISLTGEVLPY